MDEENKTFTLAGKTYHEGDWISIDGSTGNIYGERHPHRRGDHLAATSAASWAGPISSARLQVRTNADTPRDTAQAVKFGAEGIGLCRTEHMFFEADRIKAMREMICSETVEQREKALAKMLPISRATSRRSTRPWRAVP